MSRVKRVISVVITVFALIPLQPLSAQTNNQTESANGFRISPVRNELTIEKGKSQTATITVENPSGLPFKAKAVINDFVPSDKEDGEPRLLLDNTSAKSHSLRKLIKDIPVIELAPRERKSVLVTVSIPEDAAAGGYYGAVRFLPAEERSEANVSLTASVASLFLVNVPGDIKLHLELVEFTAAQNEKAKKLITGGSVSIITRFKNDGDTHEKPFGKIQVKNSKGKLVAEAEINNIEPQSNVLPGSIRKFETKLKDQKWFGKYTVTASYSYTPSANNEPINASTTFWYIPTWLLTVILIALILLLAAGYLMYRKLSSKGRRRR